MKDLPERRKQVVKRAPLRRKRRAKPPRGASVRQRAPHVANRQILDKEDKRDTLPFMRSVIQTDPQFSRPSTFLLTANRRECLHRWIKNQLRIKTHPDKRSLLMVNKILEQQNINSCPLCGNEFELSDYHETITIYWICSKIRCSGCRHDWVLQESHVA
jgi:hypothetical protein